MFPLWAAAMIGGCAPEGSAPLADHAPPSAAVELDLRIDGHAVALEPIVWMGVSPAGGIALLHSTSSRIRFFDSSGREIGTFGRAGDGPGEFRNPRQGGWIGDTLWIADGILRRVTLIAPDRQLVRMIRTDGVGPAPGSSEDFPTYSLATPHALYPGDTLLVQGTTVVSGPAWPSSLVRTTADGFIRERVMDVPSGQGGNVPIPNGSMTVPFFARPQWSVAPTGDRIAILDVDWNAPDERWVRFSVVDPHGEELFARRIEVEPLRIPPSVVDSVVADRLASPILATFGAGDGFEENLREAIPAHYPPVTAVIVGTDRRSWVGLAPTNEGNPWLVFDAEGTLLAHVILPSRVRLRAADATHLYGEERDELDVGSVVRYRLKMP